MRIITNDEMLKYSRVFGIASGDIRHNFGIDFPNISAEICPDQWITDYHITVSHGQSSVQRFVEISVPDMEPFPKRVMVLNSIQYFEDQSCLLTFKTSDQTYSFSINLENFNERYENQSMYDMADQPVTMEQRIMFNKFLLYTTQRILLIHTKSA